MKSKPKHLIDAKSLSSEDIMFFLETAQNFKLLSENHEAFPSLKGFAIANMFNDASSRLRFAFERAEKLLACSSMSLTRTSASPATGESMEDVLRVLQSYEPDLIIVGDRHTGVPSKVARLSKAQVINAGDGINQNPAQALADLFAIWRQKGAFKDLRVGIVGDVKRSCICGSLIPALKTLGAKVSVVAAPTMIPIHLQYLGVETVIGRIEDALPELDVVYMLPLQDCSLEQAPYPSLREYSMLYGLDRSKEHLLVKDALVMHPGPIRRGVEIDDYMAGHSRHSFIDSQSETDIFACMAMLYLLLKGGKDEHIA